MTRIALALSSLLCLLSTVHCPLSTSASAAESEEDKFIAILQSDKPANEKAWACRKLKLAGTLKSVPALAACLPDKELAHSARYALEVMPYPEAAAALRNAVPKATGLAKAGIIDSIGDRRDKEAVPLLAPLAADADPNVASSAASSLGKIGGAEAIAALKAARPKAPETARLAVADGLLFCADHLLRAGHKPAAAAVFKDVLQPSEPEHIRQAAWLGIILSADDPLPLLASGLAGSDRAAQRATLIALHQLKGEATTKAAAAQIVKASPKVQVALIEVLGQRGDAAAAPAIIEAAKSAEAPVRIAALHALSFLGDPAAVPALAEAATKEEGAVQETARAALARITGKGVREALTAQLEKGSPATQAELVRALGARRDAGAVPALMKIVETGDSPSRMAAVRSLGMLADEKCAGILVPLLAGAKTDAERDDTEKALVSICARSKDPAACAAPALAAMKGADVPTRAALLRVAGRAGGPEAIKELRAGIADKEAAIQDAAIRTLADTGGIETLPDLLQVAKESPNAAHKVIALRGYWRLVGLTADRPADDRLKMCEAGIAAAPRPDEKKLGLAELAKVPTLAALQLAENLAKDAAVQAEAETACVRIALALGRSNPAESKAALRRIIASAKNADARAEAEKAMGIGDRFVGFITAWSYCGPYRIQGKEASQLFDISVGPEKQGEKVAWKLLPPPADASLSWQADLSNLTGGDHCLMYLRTRVFCPKEQRVRLEIGTDDGIKLWINDKLVHSNNAIRGLKAGDDLPQATLKEGWNDFFLKITQHTMGCGACIRIRAADGSTIEGLRFDGAAPPPQPAKN